jgi:hypothetical protein
MVNFVTSQQASLEAPWIILFLAIILGFWSIAKNNKNYATISTAFGQWIILWQLQRRTIEEWLVVVKKRRCKQDNVPANFEFLHPTNACRLQDVIASADNRTPSRALLVIFASLEVPAGGVADGQEEDRSSNNNLCYRDLARRLQQNTRDYLLLHVVIVSSHKRPGLLETGVEVGQLIEQAMSICSWEAQTMHTVICNEHDPFFAATCSTSNATTIVPLFHDLNTCILVHGAATCKTIVGLRRVVGKFNSFVQLDAIAADRDDQGYDDFSSIPGPLMTVLFREHGQTCPLQATALYRNLLAGKDYSTKTDHEVKTLKLLWRKPVVLVKSASDDMAHVAQVVADFVLVSLPKNNGGSLTLPTSSTTSIATHMTRLRQEILQTKAELWDDSPFGQLTTRQALEEFVVSVVDQFYTTPVLTVEDDNLLQYHQHLAQEDRILQVIPEFHSSRMDFAYSKPCLRKWMQHSGSDDSLSSRQHEQHDHIVQAWPQSSNENVVVASDLSSLQQRQQPPTLEVLQSSPTLALKLKSPEAILGYFKNLSDTVVAVTPTPIPQVSEWNRAIFDQVLESRQLVTGAEREHYQRGGLPLVFVPDTALQTGPDFVDSKLILRWEASDVDDDRSQPATTMQSDKKSVATKTKTAGAAYTSRIQRVTLSSPILYTPVNMMPTQFAAKFGGMFYCKVLTPAQAYEWIVYDSFRAKQAVAAAPIAAVDC